MGNVSTRTDIFLFIVSSRDCQWTLPRRRIARRTTSKGKPRPKIFPSLATNAILPLYAVMHRIANRNRIVKEFSHRLIHSHLFQYSFRLVIDQQIVSNHGRQQHRTENSSRERKPPSSFQRTFFRRCWKKQKRSTSLYWKHGDRPSKCHRVEQRTLESTFLGTQQVSAAPKS